MTEKTYRRLSRLPMSAWGKALRGFCPSDLSEIERMATREAVRLCRLAEYAGTRGGFGCGDHGHADAVKAQNRKAAKVRAAIGFTQHRDEINFPESQGGAQ